MAWITLTVRHSRMQEVAAQLAGMPEVDYVVMTTGVWNIMVEVACVDHADLYRLLGRLRALPGVQQTESYPYLHLLRQQFQWTNHHDEPASAPPVHGVRAAPAEIDDLDAQIILQLHHDGRAPFREIGARLGISERTVSSRYARLTADNLVRVIAVGNPHALGFSGLAWLGIQLSDGASLEEVASELAEIAQLSYLVSASGRYDLMAELVCRNPDHLLATLSTKVGTVAGISTIETFYYLRLMYRKTAVAWGAARARNHAAAPAGLSAARPGATEGATDHAQRQLGSGRADRVA
jgi:Lrp/AsnC family transcriptional regulator for asnA, asnC and gidA